MSVDKLNFEYVRQSKKGFTTFLNEVIQNIPDQGMLALYIYLDSLPPNWQVNRQHLMNHFNIGRKKLGDQLKWLNDHYLIEYVQERNKDGTMGKCGIAVRDGVMFIEQIINKQQHDTALPEIGIPVSTALPENRTAVEPQYGESPTIEQTIHCFKKETKEQKGECLKKEQKLISPTVNTEWSTYQPAESSPYVSPLLASYIPRLQHELDKNNVQKSNEVFT